MSAAVCFSGMSARQRARRSAPPSLSTVNDRSSTYSSVPMATSTTPSPLPCRQCGHQRFPERNTLRRRACPGGGSAMVLAVSTTIKSRLALAGGRQRKTLTVLAVTPIRPRETSSMYAKASTPSPSNSSRKRFSPGRNARHNIADPMPPLLDTAGAGDRPCLPGVHPNNTLEGFGPYHLATSGVSAGAQLITSASTAVLLTVLKALEQSVRTSQLLGR